MTDPILTGVEALSAHLKSGATSICRCWSLRRRDGVVLGFTDHDRDLTFDGITFRAESGLTARAVQQSTGLSVDNSEALGALSAPSITEADIEAGRLDDAEITAWLVNWRDPDARKIEFRGHLGEITRAGGAFRAELRGLADRLNQPRGRVFQGQCSAVVGDRACGVNLTDPAFRLDGSVLAVEAGQRFEISDPGDFAGGWFKRGVLTVLDGPAAGLTGNIKIDAAGNGSRVIGLWETLRADVRVGTAVRLTAGCDKSAATCRSKFDNMLNFRGFPHIPGDDWVVSYPRQGGQNDGGKLT